MTRQVQSKDKCKTAEIVINGRKAYLILWSSGSSSMNKLGHIGLDKFRLGLLIDQLTAAYNEMEGNLKELTLMVPEDAVVTVDGEEVPNE